ncbi:ABC transporter permease [Marinivivus vitaminiproducens]|uniref:ABC transporter permease n=1 Tax=Marinivivus vitaminiproducens TaxID=3035935 RepID=UPI0027AB5DF2|nr:ABC transporter permease [Geminicoccaceae bacterium SCSIO 64248]
MATQNVAAARALDLEPRTLRLPGITWALIGPAVALLLIFYIWPLVQVLLISVTEVDDRAAGMALGNYGLLFVDEGVQRMLWRTAQICVTTTVLTLIGGYIIAYAMVHVTGRQRSFLMFAVLLSFWLSVLIRAFAWIVLLNNNGLAYEAINLFWQPLRDTGIVQGRLQLARTEAGVIIGMVHYMLPYAVLPLFANMQGIDQRVMMAARGLGASPFGAFRRVYLPLSAPGLLGATVLVFVFSLGFFITPSLMGGGKVVMISEYIWFSMEQTLRWGLATMLATTLLIAVMALIALMSRFVDMKQMYGAK